MSKPLVDFLGMSLKANGKRYYAVHYDVPHANRGMCLYMKGSKRRPLHEFY